MANRADAFLSKAKKRKEDNLRIYTEAVRTAVTSALSDDNLIIANIAASSGSINSDTINQAAESITTRVVANITDAVANFRSTIQHRNIPPRSRDIGIRKYFKEWLCEAKETPTGTVYYESETGANAEDLDLEYKEAKVAEYLMIDPAMWDQATHFDWVEDSNVYGVQ